MTTEAKIVTGITVGTLLLLFGAVFFFSKSAPSQVVSDPGKLIRDDSPKIASGSGKLTIVEFGDFQCPACQAAQEPFMQAFNEHKDQVIFVFRHYPLPQHKNAINGAKAAEAAFNQGKFFEMDSLLYKNQTGWVEQPNPEELFVSYAQQLNLNIDQFKQDYESDKSLAKINRDQADGTTLGVRGTPTFFFNGKMYNDRFDYTSFKRTIESYLK